MKEVYKKIAFLFPGQGAQYPQMAQDFINNFKVARETFQEANDLLKRDLTSIVLEGPLETLTQTHYSQPAIYVTSIAILRVVQELYGIVPFVCSGLSLGEYTALTASNRLLFSETLPLVQHRGTFMGQACEDTQGTMAVVMGLPTDVVEKCIRDVNLPQDLWIANFNCPGQVVISGTLKGIAAGTEAAKNCGAKRVLPLQVHGAFHSGLMRQAQHNLLPYIQASQIKDSAIRLVMNVPGEFVDGDKEVIKENLVSQVTQSVKWEQGLVAMAREKVDLFVAFGPSQTLAGLNNRMNLDIPTITIDKMTHLDLIEELKTEGKIA